MYRTIAPLAFLMIPGIAFAQRGRGAEHAAAHPAAPASAAATRPVPPEQMQVPTQVPQRVPRQARPTQRVLNHRNQPTLSNGDVTRSERADVRANDVTARATHKRKHQKKQKPGY